MKKIVLAAVAVICVSSVFGQGAEQALRLSRYNWGMSTARSAAMGGAYTSLGADASSMNINPAGLAMYSRSEVTISPGLRISDLSTNYSGANSNTISDSKFNITNMAAIYANGDFAVGVGFSRLADFAGRSASYGTPQEMSMGQQFAEQLYGIDYTRIGSPENNPYQAFRNYPPVLWGAIQGYQSYLLNNYTDDTYNMAGIFDPQYGDRVLPQMMQRTNGAIDEYTISGAYNYNNKLYVGASLGFQNIWYNENNDYSEITAPDGAGELNNWTYNRYMNQDGFGFNIKVGAIVRPLEWLRIGVAYHSPTWVRVDEQSSQSMTVYKFGASGYGFSDTPLLLNDYRIQTPSRLMAGVSFTIAKRVIISGDYERTWYKNMGYKTEINDWGFRPEVTSNAVDNLTAIANNMDSRGNIDLNNIISQSYRTVDNFRVGVEAQPFNGAFIRAGYAHSTSPYADETLRKYGALNQYSGGIGYRNNRVSIDATYVYQQTKQLPYKYFDYTANDGYIVASQGQVNTTLAAHNIILTIGFRF